MGLPNEIFPLLAAKLASQEYTISKSLRFNAADSAYLNRTFTTPTDSTIYTLSLWVKRSELSTRNIFSNSSITNLLGFNSSDQIALTLNNTAITTSTAVFRDTNAWYHIVYQKNGSAHTIYVNNSSIATGSSTAGFNTAVTHRIGYSTATAYFSGYTAEIYFVDGQALTPSSFGETNTTTGVWIPKQYTGTYGNNGFYLNFSDNSGITATTLGKDYSINGNNWTPNNFSVTSGAGNDSLEDTPTNNFPSFDRIFVKTAYTATITNGNLDISASRDVKRRCNFAIPTSGKWYIEFDQSSSNSDTQFGLETDTTDTSFYNQDTTTYVKKSSTGNFTPTALPLGQGIWQIAYDVDNDKIWFGFNNSWINSGDPSAGTGATNAISGNTFSMNGYGNWFPFIVNSSPSGAPTTTTGSINFGQRSFAYTPPTGFKALNTTNMPTPIIIDGTKYMNAITWTGNGNTRSLTGVGFQPDLIWSKSRSNSETHKLVDSVRGTTKALSAETTGDEVTESGITSFDSNGFTIDGATDTGYNTNTYTYVGWCWKKGAIPGFDIVTYTGNGSSRTISHSLSAVPHFMIIKARTTAGTDQGWAVYHRNTTSSSWYLLFNSNAAQTLDSTVFGSTPTSSVFSVGTNALVNTNNDTYVAYLWTEIAGFSRFGSYTGNGSADGPFIWCGFRPKFVIVKQLLTQHWAIRDTVRLTTNPNIYGLNSSLPNAETLTSADVDMLSSGFKIRSTSALTNSSGGTYVFAAFAENSIKYSRAR